MSLNAVPPEVLEHIAFFVATDPILGPPKHLTSLISLSKRTYDTLSLDKNPILYARICAAKFDLSAPKRRLGEDAMTAPALANELVKRCQVLGQLRSLAYARMVDVSLEEERILDKTLWTAFFMVLEDNGRNVAQMRNAQIAEWLNAYWFDQAGSSAAVYSLQSDAWFASGLGASVNSISANRCSAHLPLAMWLLWFFFEPASYIAQHDRFRKAERLLKLVVLNAPVYPLTQAPWTSFDARPSDIHFGIGTTRSDEPIDPYDRVASIARSQAPIPTFTHFNTELKDILPPPAAPAAILAYLALTSRARRDAHEGSIYGAGGGIHVYDAFETRFADGQGDSYVAFTDVGGGFRGGSASTALEGRRWDGEWERTIDANCLQNSGNDTVRAFIPGSLDGAWEGSFTYTEFHSFAALLAGARPSKLDGCVLAQHNQTWRLREHHLLAPALSSLSSSPTLDGNAPPDSDTVQPLPVGCALLAHVPDGAQIQEGKDGLSIVLPPGAAAAADGTGPGVPTTCTYTHYVLEAHQAESAAERDAYRARVRDILLTGEGHSGWGEFRLVGRVRPCDGFISILKEYTGGDRGRWLYRGYLIGGGDFASVTSDTDGELPRNDGYLVGRWRDTLTPVETHGYEGAFALTRRR